jgi:hypothetical protein
LGVARRPATQDSCAPAGGSGIYARSSRVRGGSHTFFGYRAQLIALDLNELFRVGRRALAIGLTVLSFALSSVKLPPPTLRRVLSLVEESLIICGWVANWRPIQIFLYDWWPIVRQRNLYRRLSAAQLELRPYKMTTGEGSCQNDQVGAQVRSALFRMPRMGAPNFGASPALCYRIFSQAGCALLRREQA